MSGSSILGFMSDSDSVSEPYVFPSIRAFRDRAEERAALTDWFEDDSEWRVMMLVGRRRRGQLLAVSRVRSRAGGRHLRSEHRGHVDNSSGSPSGDVQTGSGWRCRTSKRSAVCRIAVRATACASPSSMSFPSSGPRTGSCRRSSSRSSRRKRPRRAQAHHRRQPRRHDAEAARRAGAPPSIGCVRSRHGLSPIASQALLERAPRRKCLTAYAIAAACPGISTWCRAPEDPVARLAAACLDPRGPLFDEPDHPRPGARGAAHVLLDPRRALVRASALGDLVSRSGVDVEPAWHVTSGRWKTSGPSRLACRSLRRPLQPPSPRRDR